MHETVTNRVANLAHKILGQELPSVSLAAHLPPTDGIALAAFNVHFMRDSSQEAVAQSISQLFDGRVRVLEGTIQQEQVNGRHHYVTCRLQAVRPVKVVKPDADGHIEGFMSLNKNLYMSQADRTSWGLTKNGDTALLIRQGDLESDEALSQILASLQSTSSSQDIKARSDLVDRVQATASSLETGTLISYIQAGTRQHKLGFALSGADQDKVQVVPFSGQVEEVSTSHITDAFAAESYQSQLVLPRVEHTSTSAPSTINDLVKYYRRVYGANDEFFTRWERKIRGHRFNKDGQ